MISRATITSAIAISCVLCAGALPAVAQDRTYTDALKTQWDQIKDYITKAADQMPEDVYAFKPTPKIRSFGELIAHVSDASYGICALATSDKAQSFGNAEKTMQKKADIQAALKAAFVYCDAAFQKLDDQSGRETTDLMGQPQPASCRACVQHPAHVGALRQPRDVFPPQGHGPTVEPARHVATTCKDAG